MIFLLWSRKFKIPCFQNDSYLLSLMIFALSVFASYFFFLKFYLPTKFTALIMSFITN